VDTKVIEPFSTEEDIELKNIPLSVTDDEIKTSVIDIELFRESEHEVDCSLWHIIKIKDTTLSDVI